MMGVVMLDLSKLIRDYEANVIGEWDIFWRLCKAGAEQPPEEIADAIPRDWLIAMKDACDDTETQSESEFLSMTPREHIQEGRRIFDGLNCWRKYLADRSDLA